jgi:hypothetical protein
MTTAREIELMGSDGYTVLALALDAAMLSSASARASYKAIYGVEWVCLSDVEVKSFAVSTTVGTVR